MPNIGNKPLCRVKTNISYGSHGQRNLLDAYLPMGAKSLRPGIVFIHGGGWMGGDKASLGWMAEDAARRGFCAFSINYRFSTHGPYPVPFLDVQRAVRWIRAHAGRFRLDPARIGAWGDSAGGHLASLLALTELTESDPKLAKYSSRIRCACDVYGPVDLVDMMNNESAPIVQQLIGRPLQGSEALYRYGSPTHYVHAGAPPFLLIHGTLDDGRRRGSVPWTLSRNFYRQLKNAGVKARLEILKGADHGFGGRPEIIHARKAWDLAVRFFEQTLDHKSPANLGPMMKHYASMVDRMQASRLLPPPARIQQARCPNWKENLGWRQAPFLNNFFFSLHEEIMKTAPAEKLVYFRCRFNCPEPMKVALMFGYDGPVKVFCDGKEVFCDPKGINPIRIDEARAVCECGKGRHEIVFALMTNKGLAWGVCLRIQRVDITQGRAGRKAKRLAVPKLVV
ncbi:MAG: alpha/beta hydrolase [Planctomycetes bacterium]|nr:alpha/beta hydrolase [Planctomycetota bacterium]